MHRRQYLRSVGVVVAGSLAGCARSGGRTGTTTQFDDTPGVSGGGIDVERLATTVRDHVETESYDFEWVTDGETRGRSFFRARYDRRSNCLLVHTREGGTEYAAYYTESGAYRNDSPATADASDYTRPSRTVEDLTDTFPAALERLTRVWLSEYEYDPPVRTDDGIRVAITGGHSQVPYELADASGALRLTGTGLVERLAVSGVPYTTGGGTRQRLDTAMDLSLSLDVGGRTVPEPEWVEEIRG